MSLINFGSILGFAEEIETQHQEFYTRAAASGNVDPDALAPLLKTTKKRISEVQRIRRENVTEMILETISGFSREPYLMEEADPSGMDAAQAIAHALAMTDRSIAYYQAAAKKLSGQADTARGLKMLGKKHDKDRKVLAGLS